MMVRSMRLSVAMVALLALGLIATEPAGAQDAVPAVPGVDDFIANKSARARNLQSQGDLAGALREWRYVTAVAPNSSEARDAIRSLDQQIASRSAAYLRDADAERSKGRTKQARTLYLKVLALDPLNTQAKSRLRDMERSALLAGQDRKDQAALEEYRTRQSAQKAAAKAPESDISKIRSAFGRKQYGSVITLAEDSLKKSPNDKTIGDFYARANIALARSSLKAGKSDAVLSHLEAASDAPGAETTVQAARKELVEDAYANGLDQMNKDIDKAVKWLSLATRIDPSHLKAKSELDRATKMQERLKMFE